MDVRLNRSIPLWTNLMFYAVFAWLIIGGYLASGSSSWVPSVIALGVPLAVAVGFTVWVIGYNRRVGKK